MKIYRYMKSLDLKREYYIQLSLRIAAAALGVAAAFYWRRIGKKKPPVQLGVDKKTYSKRKDLLW